MQRDCCHLLLLREALLGQGILHLGKGSSFVFLSTETLHYHDDQVRRVLATVEDIISLDRGLDVILEGSVVEHLPGPIDLVEHIVLNLVSLFFQTFNFSTRLQSLFHVLLCTVAGSPLPLNLRRSDLNSS